MTSSLVRRLSFVALLLLPASSMWTATTAHAAWPTTTAEDVVLAEPAGHGKSIQQLIPDASGGVYVSWLDHPPYGALPELRILRLDVNGDVAPGWPAAGVVPPRPSNDWTRAVLAADGAGGLFGAWPVGTTAMTRLALVRLGPDGTLASGWPATVDVAYASGLNNLSRLQLAADAGGVYVAWAYGTVVRLERRALDGALPPGWMTSGDVVTSDGYEVSLRSDGGSGALLGWQELGSTHLQRLQPDATPPTGWPAGGLALASTTYTLPSAVPIEIGPAGELFAYGGGFRRIEADGTIPADWPAAGVVLDAYTEFLDMVPRADGSLLYAYRRFETVPWTSTIGAVAADGSTAPGWPAEGRSLGACYSALAFASSDALGFTLLDQACGSPSVIEARRFAPDGTPSSQWPSAVVPVANAASAGLSVVSARDGSDGTVIGWSNLDRGAWSTDLRLKRLRDDGALGAGAVAAVEPARASGLALAAPVPNPSHGPTVLAFDLPRAMRVSVVLHDLAGRRVRTLVDAHLPAGRSAPRWDGRDDAGRALPAGVYLAHLTTEEGTRTRRVSLLP